MSPDIHNPVWGVVPTAPAPAPANPPAPSAPGPEAELYRGWASL